VVANDSDAKNNPLTAVLVSGPSKADSFTLNPDGTFTYVHNGSETTSDSFTYKANDGSLDSNTTTVTITITPVNDAPVANPDAYNVTFHGTLNVAAPGVLGNDTDADGPGLTAILVSTTTQGSLTFNADGSFSYTHTGLAPGTDSFTYKANDGSLDSNVTTVTITIANQTPVAGMTHSLAWAIPNCASAQVRQRIRRQSSAAASSPMTPTPMVAPRRSPSPRSTPSAARAAQ